MPMPMRADQQSSTEVAASVREGEAVVGVAVHAGVGARIRARNALSRSGQECDRLALLRHIGEHRPGVGDAPTRAQPTTKDQGCAHG